MSATAAAGARAFRLEPQYRERVWGGQRLRAADPPIGEAWIAFADSRVAGGPAAGRTVERLVSDDPAGILGEEVADRHGSRFPLLLKFLDTADWLSVQVHPNDAQAERLIGPGEWGKTEAWYVLDAEPDARGRVGVRSGTTRDQLATAIRDGRVLDLMPDLAFRAGETILVPAGTLHTLGPGLLLYEAQQASDATFRAHDWDRPPGADRPLHVDQSIAVADPAAAPIVAPSPVLAGTAVATVASSRYFRLDLLQVGEVPLAATTEGRSFHLLTAIDGSVEIAEDGPAVVLGPRETALIVGAAGAYRVAAIDAAARLMRASVPA